MDFPYSFKLAGAEFEVNCVDDMGKGSPVFCSRVSVTFGNRYFQREEGKTSVSYERWGLQCLCKYLTLPRVGGSSHGDNACMNFVIGHGDNGNNVKKTLQTRGLMALIGNLKLEKAEEIMHNLLTKGYTDLSVLEYQSAAEEGKLTVFDAGESLPYYVDTTIGSTVYVPISADTPLGGNMPFSMGMGMASGKSVFAEEEPVGDDDDMESNV